MNEHAVAAAASICTAALYAVIGLDLAAAGIRWPVWAWVAGIGAWSVAVYPVAIAIMRWRSP